MLGFVSLFMDVSSELIHSLLPVFMVTSLGATALVVGLVEGIAEATALIVKVFSGTLSDYLGKRKALAVFGYGGRVQLLTRRPGAAWEVRTLFEDIDRGHWLAAAELDGRNGTDELLCTGYSGRIVLLARPPGYGLPGTATDPDGPAPPSGAQP